MERKNIYIVILTITTIIAACLAVYFAVNPIVNENEEINNNDNVVLDEIKEEVDTSTDKVEEEEPVDIDNSTTVEPVVTEKIVYRNKIPTIDTTKCINPREGMKYSISRSAEGSDVYATIINSKEIRLTVKSNRTDYVKLNDTNSDEAITNFSGNVIDVCILNDGQGVNEYLFFLMEDGTVEYMPFNECFAKQEFKSYGKISGVENVIEVVRSIYNRIIAIREDGSFYDLSNILQKIRMDELQ